jgi:hypothetical protein
VRGDREEREVLVSELVARGDDEDEDVHVHEYEDEDEDVERRLWCVRRLVGSPECRWSAIEVARRVLRCPLRRFEVTVDSPSVSPPPGMPLVRFVALQRVVCVGPAGLLVPCSRLAFTVSDEADGFSPGAVPP